jgi:hypothetical protein
MSKSVLLASTAPTPKVAPKPPKQSKALVSARPAARPRAVAARQPRKRQARGPQRGTGRNDADDNGGDSDPDQLVPDPQVCREFSISAMSLWRWDRDPVLNFPPRISIRGRNFRSRKQIEAFKQRLLRGAIAKRSRELEGA